MKINVVTPPDKVHTDGLNVLLVTPTDELLKGVQTHILEPAELDANVYICNEDNIIWLLDIFAVADIVILDIDNMTPTILDMVSYFLAKTKTYWLTKGEKIVYNTINRNRIYSLNDLKDIGGNIVESQ